MAHSNPEPSKHQKFLSHSHDPPLSVRACGGDTSHIWCPYVDTNVNISALRCDNCNIEKVEVDELVRVVYTNRCTYGDLCCVTCQPGQGDAKVKANQAMKEKPIQTSDSLDSEISQVFVVSFCL